MAKKYGVQRQNKCNFGYLVFGKWPAAIGGTGATLEDPKLGLPVIGFGASGRGGGARPPPPLFGQGGAHHFELQPLICIVCSGKVITLTQQCITQVTKVTTNSQQDP